MNDTDNTAGKRAWQFLMRNPGYVMDWWMWGAGTPPPQGAPFPVRTQTASETEEAALWGLLAWEDPLAGSGTASPFWSVAPTLEAVSVPGNAVFAELLETPDARLTGLRLRDGAMVLKAERGDAAVQLRIADGESFDFSGGVALVIPAGLETQVRLRSAADLWPFGASKAKRGVSGCLSGSCSWRWTCSRRARASARSAWRFARTAGSRREAGRTATCARWRGGGSRRRIGR